MSDEISTLRARVAELEATLKLKNADLRARYKLTPAMNSILGLMLELPMVNDELLQERLGLAADAKVAVFRLRKQLEPHGIKIQCRRGSGWFLDDLTKDRIRREITSEVSDAA